MKIETEEYLNDLSKIGNDIINIMLKYTSDFNDSINEESPLDEIIESVDIYMDAERLLTIMGIITTLINLLWYIQFKIDEL
ncbi:MAG: hypothetical protein PHO28_04155 [Candidatus Pacebacteria bacterium]|nr:hypothetical protein [Candidatus Paceibacterota bacterium]